MKNRSGTESSASERFPERNKKESAEIHHHFVFLFPICFCFVPICPFSFHQHYTNCPSSPPITHGYQLIASRPLNHCMLTLSWRARVREGVCTHTVELRRHIFCRISSTGGWEGLNISARGLWIFKICFGNVKKATTLCYDVSLPSFHGC